MKKGLRVRYILFSKDDVAGTLLDPLKVNSFTLTNRTFEPIYVELLNLLM